jgi:hypothetical protein
MTHEEEHMRFDPQMIDEYPWLFALTVALSMVYGAIVMDRCQVDGPYSKRVCAKGTPSCDNPFHVDDGMLDEYDFRGGERGKYITKEKT